VFVNRPLAQLARDLGLSTDPATVRAGALGTAFLSRFPLYPVLLVRLRPGEGYVAPTENIVHDASTEGATAPDLAYTYHGRFTPADETDELSPDGG
jgi:hypothetical protein